MDWLKLLQEIFDVCIIPLLGILTTYAISYIKAKRNEVVVGTENELVKKYTEIASEVIERCVIATNQVYVDSMKNKNAFDINAQKEAYNMTKESIMTILTEEAKEVLSIAYGDLDRYIDSSIEYIVKQNK